jgi:hypothetical protein
MFEGCVAAGKALPCQEDQGGGIHPWISWIVWHFLGMLKRAGTTPTQVRRGKGGA